MANKSKTQNQAHFKRKYDDFFKKKTKHQKNLSNNKFPNNNSIIEEFDSIINKKLFDVKRNTKITY